MNNEGQVKQEKTKKISTLEGVACSPSGSPMAPVFKRVYDERVKRSIVKKVDETNLQEFIQASASQTDLALLEKRFMELGEIPQVNSDLSFDNDISQFPDDIHGIYQLVNDVNGNFAKLPKTIQEAFGNNSQVYLSALLNGTYQSTLINHFNSLKKDDKKDDPKEGENK